MFWNFRVGIHRDSTLTLKSLNLILHVCETRKFVMATLHRKQGLLGEKSKYSMSDRRLIPSLHLPMISLICFFTRTFNNNNNNNSSSNNNNQIILHFQKTFFLDNIMSEWTMPCISEIKLTHF